MMSTSRAKTDSDQNGYAGIDSSAAIAFSPATVMPNQRPNAPPFQIEKAAAICSAPTHHPAPGVQPAEDVLLVGDEEPRIADGRDPVDHVQDADHHDQDPGEQDPAGAAGVVVVPAGRLALSYAHRGHAAASLV